MLFISANVKKVNEMKGLLVGIAVVGMSASALARPELNAFINKPANTVPELLMQIKSDKSVADRFMRHFSMSREEVIEYVGSLHLGTIEKSQYYTIYSAPENGIIKSHISFFKKGTPAFVDADGNAILRVKCGNPFVPGPVRAYATQDPMVEAGGDSPSAIDINVGGAVASGIPTASYQPKDFHVEVPSNNISLRNTGSGSSQGQGFIGALTGLGAAASFINTGSSSPTPVPEPATLAILGLGASALLKRRKK